MVRRNDFWSIWTPQELAKVPERHKERLAKEWNFRKACFDRDNFTCQKCGFKEPEETIYEKNMNVTVHHLIPQEYTQDEKLKFLIYEPNNGVTFCQNCHTRWHKGKFRFDWRGYRWFVYDVIEKIHLNKIDEIVRIITGGK